MISVMFRWCLPLQYHWSFWWKYHIPVLILLLWRRLWIVSKNRSHPCDPSLVGKTTMPSPNQTNVITTGDFTLGNVTSCNGTHFVDFVYLSDLNLSNDFFLFGRFQQAFHRHFDFIDGLVNDRIGLIWTPFSQPVGGRWKMVLPGNQWWWASRSRCKQYIRILKFVLQLWNYPHLDGLLIVWSKESVKASMDPSTSLLQ